MTSRRSFLAAVLAAALCAPGRAAVRSVSVVEPGPSGTPAGLGGVKTPGATGLSALAPMAPGLSSQLSASAVPQVKEARLSGPAVVPAAVQAAPAVSVLAPEVKAEAPAPQAAAVPVAAQEAAKTLAESKDQKESAPGLFRRMARLFDGTRQAAPEPVLADYLQSAPQLPLPPLNLLPVWNGLSPSAAKAQVRFQLDSLEKWGAGAGSMRGLSEDRAAPEVVSRESREAGGLARLEWPLPAGSRQAMVDDYNLFYVDAQGRLVVQDLRNGDARAYSAPGRISRFLPTGSDEVQVVVDGKLESWRLKSRDAVQVSGEGFDAGSIGAMVANEEGERTGGFSLYFPGGRVRWSQLGVEKYQGALRLTEDGAQSEGLVPAGAGLYFRVADGKSTVWKGSNSSFDVEELGELPYELVSMVRAPGGKALLAVTAQGLVQYDLESRRYRFFAVPGLAEAASQGELRIQAGNDRVFIVAGPRLLDIDPARLTQETSKTDLNRLWSENNPMYVRDGMLHIGGFTFPIGKRTPKPLPWTARLAAAFKRAIGRPAPPAEVLDLGISQKDWQAVNLPANKRLIYDTLKGFTLNQHVLYIGETGGGKTWIAQMLAQLTGNELWMVSMNEYTRNKDLIARETFGEEGKNKTGLTASTVLRWMQEGGILLLDEMHKPLEGIAILNNILQNGEYRLPDGRVVKYDKRKSWVIGTMNPVKPPYKGEPPSGELSSRFGMTLEVKYLPAEEEAALLRIFYNKVPQGIVEKLVAIANDLRKIYPEILPLPIAPRTLMHIVEHAQKYPHDQVSDIFSKTYNPASIVEDQAIADAIARVLKAHGLSGQPAEYAAAEAARRDVREIFKNRNPTPPSSSGGSQDWRWENQREFDYGGYDYGGFGGFGHMNFHGRHLPPMPFTSPRTREVPPVTPEMEGWANALQNVARMLAQYPPLRLVPFYLLEKHGEYASNTERRWRAVTGMEEIHYLPEDMGEADRDVALGRTAHETWHFVFSRPELIFDNPEFIENMSFQALWWAVEDPRVNNLGLSRHPGAKPWLDAAYAKDYAIGHLDFERQAWSQIPLHLQFNYGLIYQWWKGEPDPRITDPRVLDALERASTAIKRAVSTEDAAKSFAIVRDQIWPIYKELLDEQVQDETQDQQQKQKGKKGQKGQKGQKGSQDQQDGEEQDSDDQDQDSDDQQQSSSGQQGQKKQRKQKPGQSGQQGEEQDEQADQQKDSQGQDGQSAKEKKKAEEERARKEKQVREKLEEKSKEYRDKHAPKVTDDPEKMSKDAQEKAKKEMEELRKKQEQARQKGDKSQKGQKGQQGQEGQQKGQPGQKSEGEGQGKGSSDKAQDAAQKAKQKERLNKADEEKKELSARDRAHYQDYLKRVQRLVPVMRQQFLHALKQKLRQRTIHNRDTGDLDPDALPRIPKGDRDVFMEEFSPNKVLYRISMLIDTSGSMDGDKKERAMEGAVMMMEALEKIPGVVFEIVKYDSNPSVLKPFGRKLTPDMKAGILAAIRDGSGSTEAYKALKEAIERVRLGRGDKMIIMVNDGDPDYNFDRDAYRKMIGEAKDVEIHGIGLGPQAQLVLDLFPPGRGWWLKDAADFAKNLRNILRKKLMGGRG